MDCIAKKHAEEVVNKLWKEISPENKDRLMSIINNNYKKWNGIDGVITFGDMPIEINGRLVFEKGEYPVEPHSNAKVTLTGNLDEYYYEILNNISINDYCLEEYVFSDIKKFIKFLVDNLDGETLGALYDLTTDQLKEWLYRVIDSVKLGNTLEFKLTWLDTYNSKDASIKLIVQNNQITFC
ncbi:MAG: hypothetical protein UH241_04845 [Acutalibacteraceae bacterium]|nr:hypothetical protein [Acutalibacteraceae bacterium]